MDDAGIAAISTLGTAAHQYPEAPLSHVATSVERGPIPVNHPTRPSPPGTPVVPCPLRPYRRADFAIAEVAGTVRGSSAT